MNNRALLGWLLVGAFCSSVSCGSNNGNGGYPQGFGLACEADDDCEQFSLMCDPADDKCVQCLSVDDCKSSEECLGGLCKALEECEDTQDCSGDLICNELQGVCVECLAARDCPSGQGCVAQQCVDQQSCAFTSDCEGDFRCEPEAGVCVECLIDNHCPSRRVCEDNECVVVGGGGTGGDGGTAGTPSTAGNNNGGTPGGGAGGSSSGTGGANGGGGSGGGGAGGGGTGGTGGMPPECDCTLGDVCTPDERCVAPTVVDDLYDCDDEILAIEGRSGPWAADADFDINLTYNFGDPGSGWADRTCAAWAIGGVAPQAVDVSYAFIGFMLNDESAYSLVGYSGLQIVLESSNSIQVVLKTTGGGYFQYTLTPIVGSNLRSAPFSSMLAMNNSLEALLDLSTVYEVQFSPTTPTDFGYAIHRVELY